MSNPLFKQYGNSSPFGNNVLQRFNQFRQSFQGDPRQQIQQMMNSGKITQQQYNQAVQMANQLMKFMK